MAINNLNVGLIILSLFCAGGLIAYVRETIRLQRLVSSGTATVGTVLKKEKIDSGSESIVHYLVTYEFLDGQGKSVIHEQDLNSGKYFQGITTGDKIEILYRDGPTGNSYPLSQIRNDLKIAQWMSIGILLFWIAMGFYLNN